VKTMLAFFDWLADHKGMPILVGIGLILVNFIVVLVASDGWAARTNVFLHIGLVIGLLGELLTDVL
jgi:hypothetical protein